MRPGSPYVFAASHAIQRPPTQAISPYGIAVPPYGHTPDASPHTPHQIPIGRPFSHSHGISPIARPFPHTIHIIDKAAGFHFDETSVRSPQTPNQPRQANTLDLRHCTANQSPTSFRKSHALRSSKPGAGQVQQITHACEWGAPSPPARTFIVTRTAMVHSRAHLHGHGTRSLSMARARPCSYLYGLCARPRQRPGTLLTRPAYGLRGSSATQLTQMP